MYQLALTMSSSSASRVEGSGTGPSMVQRFDSYFVRMKFSILLYWCQNKERDEGGAYARFRGNVSWSQFCLPVSANVSPVSSIVQYTDLFALALPHLIMLCSCSSVHESRSTDLTLLMCVPMPRWIPEHLKNVSERLGRREVVVPYTYEEAQVPASPAGVCDPLALPAPVADSANIRLFLLQSAQLLFDSSLTRLFSVARFTSARSAAGLGRRDMVGRVSCARGW
jgi:hypothetical protein